MHDNCLSFILHVFSLGRLRVSYKLLFVRSPRWKTTRLRIKTFRELLKLSVCSSTCFNFITCSSFLASGYRNQRFDMLSWYSYCWEPLHPPSSCKNWIQTVRSSVPRYPPFLMALFQDGLNYKQTCSLRPSQYSYIYLYLLLTDSLHH